jgi:HK97 family phage major capsid protein
MKNSNSESVKPEGFRYKLNLQLFAGKTLVELQQERSAVHEKQKAMLTAAETEGRDLTDVEETEFNQLEQQFLSLTADITKAESRENRAASVAAREQILNQAVNPYRPTALFGGATQPVQKDNGGFKNLGEFIHDLRFGDSKGRLGNIPVSEGEGGGKKMPEAFTDFTPAARSALRNEMTFGGEGGAESFLPQQYRPDTVLQIAPEPSIVRARAMVLPAGTPPDSKITLPALTQGSSGVFGGVEVSWISEGSSKPETDANLEEITLEPFEVAATLVVTDKLLRNWEAATPFVRRLLNNAMISAEDITFLKGNGVGKPTGILTTPGAIAVNRATANQITYMDVVIMLAKLLPEARESAIWLANQSTMPQLMTLKDPEGHYIFIQGDATKGIPSTLAGIPIKFTGRTNTLGTKGDLQLCDFSYYLIKDGSGPYIAASEHVLFRNNKTVIKCFWNVDGKPWVKAPLKLEDGVTTVSPYVILDIPQV